MSEHDTHLRIWRLVIETHIVVYSTIILMTAYAVFDEGTDRLLERDLLELLGIGFAPLFAVAMVHAFSDSIDMQVRYGRRLNRHDRRSILARNLQYLYILVPPTIIFGVLALFHVDANDAVDAVLALGIVSLFFWGALAARRAGLGWGRQLTFSFSYGLMGMFVLVIELAITH